MKKRHSFATRMLTSSAIVCWVLIKLVSAMPMAPQTAAPGQPPVVPPPSQEIPQAQAQPLPPTQPAQTPATPPPPQAINATPSGPDTVDSIERTGIQGNWVKKREWLMDAHKVNNQIQELVAQNEAIRKTFIEKYNQVKGVLDNYYSTIGMQQGQLQELFDSISRYLEKKRKKAMPAITVGKDEKIDPELQSKIDIIEASIKESKQQLDQLMLDMKSIEDLDRSLQDRLKRFDEYCNTMQEDANRAKTIVNEMWNIIDHNIARDRYYELNNNILEKIKSTQAFLQNEFTQDFDSVTNTIRTQITKAEGGINTLEAKGFIIKNRSQRVKELKLKELTSATTIPETKAATPTTQPTKTWSEQLSGYAKQITDTLVSWWNWFISLFQSAPSAAQQAKPAAATTPPPAETTTPPPPTQQLPTPEQTTTTPTMPMTPPATPPSMPITPPQQPTQAQPPTNIPSAMPMN